MQSLPFSLQIFRETKESELQNLLRAKRELEAKLAKYGHVPQDDMDSSSKLELSLGEFLKYSLGCFKMPFTM